MGEALPPAYHPLGVRSGCAKSRVLQTVVPPAPSGRLLRDMCPADPFRYILAKEVLPTSCLPRIQVVAKRPYSPNAVFTSVACSCWWTLSEPEAGEAAAFLPE